MTGTSACPTRAWPFGFASFGSLRSLRICATLRQGLRLAPKSPDPPSKVMPSLLKKAAVLLFVHFCSTFIPFSLYIARKIAARPSGPEKGETAKRTPRRQPPNSLFAYRLGAQFAPRTEGKIGLPAPARAAPPLPPRPPGPPQPPPPSMGPTPLRTAPRAGTPPPAPSARTRVSCLADEKDTLRVGEHHVAVHADGGAAQEFCCTMRAPVAASRADALAETGRAE